MKIILVGYGAMGKRVAELAEENDHEIVACLVPNEQETPYTTIHEFNNLPEADVIIDFSHPDLTLQMLSSDAVDIPMVIATTGQKEEVIEKAKIKGEMVPVFFSPNMSYGVHVLTKIVKLDLFHFGSKVMRPILKDVPVLNLILPEATDEETARETEYPYSTLEAAITRIK